MKILFYFTLIFVCLGCVEDPTDGGTLKGFDFLEFENRSTHNDSVSIHAKNKEDYTEFNSFLNDERVDLFSSITVDRAGYYELKVDALTSSDTIAVLYQFVIVDAERGGAEWGIKKFTPTAIEEKSFSISDLDFIYPTSFPKDLDLPVIFKSKAPRAICSEFYGTLYLDALETTIKNGIGSITIPVNRTESNIQVEFSGQLVNLPINDVEPTYKMLNGQITSNRILDEGGYYHINSDLTISSSVVLQIPNGCIVKVDEGVNIYNEGKIEITGSADAPVVFTCADPFTYWGGFISIGNDTKISVDHAIFAQSGFHSTPSYQYGHAKRQALFFHDNSDITFLNSFALDNIGQIFYLKNGSNLTIDNSLIQRAKTTGEIVNSQLMISESTFTDFPEYSSTYMDEDNDCIYLTKTDAVITNSAFMWSKDDGIDSGSSEGGNVEIANCYFEGIFHEGLALSSGGSVVKNHSISNCTFINNGQGIELGYSSPNHNVTVHNCYFDQNLIGVRYGDNYDTQNSGFMELTNCTFGTNLDHNIWNFVRSEWAAKEGHLVY